MGPRAPQAKLARIGAQYDPLTGQYLVPSEHTFRRVLADLDADALDVATCAYVIEVAAGTTMAPEIPRTPGLAEREQRCATSGPPNTRPRPGCCPPPLSTARP
ncbi:hypothetical protein [Streptomyces sp. NPDC003032]